MWLKTTQKPLDRWLNGGSEKEGYKTAMGDFEFDIEKLMEHTAFYSHEVVKRTVPVRLPQSGANRFIILILV